MSQPPLLTSVVQTVSISAALAGAGGMATLSLIDFPLFQSQPAERSLPLVRWLFSRGSFIFPQAGEIASIGFAYLAYDALPENIRSVSQLFKTTNGLKVNGFLSASLLVLGILPFTRLVMVPNNFALMDKNEEKGGARSEKEARGEGGKGDFASQSRPQEQTQESVSPEEEREVKQMLGKFIRQNLVRAAIMGAGGVIGLWSSLM